MTIFKRSAALVGLLAFAAACGGGDAPASETAAETGTTTEAAAPAPETPAAETATPAPGGTVHEVIMRTTQNGASGVFDPATITVKKGDVIRFIGEGAAVHNANFNVPENAGKAGLPATTNFLADGQTQDVVINMDAGTYPYQCDPHVMTGMVGSVVVE